MDVQLSSLFLANQYAFHGLIVGLVIISFSLVYVFGFKRPVEPPFDKLTNPHEDRKPNGKKRKTKEKKSLSNGHIGGSGEARKEVKQVAKKDVEKSPIKDKKSDKKQALKENRDVKPVAPSPDNSKKKGKGKENVEVRNKKNKAADEKPKDFDDGEWEQAPSRKDKKNKKPALEEIIPPKSDKKKEQKKKKDDTPEPKEEPAAPAPVATIEIQSTEETTNEPAQQKSEVGVDSDVEAVEEPKPKRGRKKRRTSGSDGGGTPEEKAPQQPVEPAKQSPAQTSSPQPSPAPTKPKKEPAPEPVPPPKSEPAAEVQPAETTVAFDELGDTWKEARAPKKGGKKKSRKE